MFFAASDTSCTEERLRKPSRKSAGWLADSTNVWLVRHDKECFASLLAA
jgi:hypothetical protein